ncbi:ferredoxin family protein [Scandinavium lactucae]|uniref:Ferredoxin-like protein n=1 Tax=Scandinavium lactucae TaxID=3095028 RepID=A0ABU4QUC8_9ENTR|nr:MULTISPECIES: ferredoxin family protein [unclassified Scandinavium]MDX6041729.1 ferredoxin family protein [Scandinavium sp. V105_6]MDX6051358.1 ferredoxin family protein [Scandinavium sp. V105_1]
MSVNESLSRNCYHPADTNHIVLQASLSEQQRVLLEKICPAGLFSRDAAGRVNVHFQGCLECGCCRLVAGDTTLKAWRYPPTGAGITLRFG